MTQIDATTKRDYPEDFTHENGNYENICASCSHKFTGHKRRLVCKECYTNSMNNELIRYVTMVIGHTLSNREKEILVETAATIHTKRIIENSDSHEFIAAVNLILAQIQR